MHKKKIFRRALGPFNFMIQAVDINQLQTSQINFTTDPLILTYGIQQMSPQRIQQLSSMILLNYLNHDQNSTMTKTTMMASRKNYYNISVPEPIAPTTTH